MRAGQEGELLHLELGFSESETCRLGDWWRHLQHWAFMASYTGVIWVVTHAVEVGVELSPRPALWSASACVLGINEGASSGWNLRCLYLIFNDILLLFCLKRNSFYLIHLKDVQAVPLDRHLAELCQVSFRCPKMHRVNAYGKSSFLAVTAALGASPVCLSASIYTLGFL